MMCLAKAARKRALQFSDNLRECLNDTLKKQIVWEYDSPPNLKFTINKSGRIYNIRMEYDVDRDFFQLFDKEMRIKRGETLLKVFPKNITNDIEKIVDKICDFIIKYAV